MTPVPGSGVPSSKNSQKLQPASSSWGKAGAEVLLLLECLIRGPKTVPDKYNIAPIRFVKKYNNDNF